MKLLRKKIFLTCFCANLLSLSFFPQNKAVGYYPDWLKYTLLPDRIKFENLTHIIHSFAWPTSSGEISMYQGMSSTGLISAAHTAGKKVLLAFGGWGQSSGFAPMTADSANRSNFIENVVGLIDQTGFDGIDLDWEFPADLTEGKNQTILVKELREKFDQIDSSLLITMAVSAGAFNGQYSEYEEMSPYIDWYSMMGYDFHGSWTQHAGHNAPLFQPPNCNDGSDHNGIKYLTITRKIPNEKILLGVPFYGKEFNSSGLYQTRTGNAADILYNDVVPRISSSSWEYCWDDFSKVPYLLNTERTKFVTFEDTTSIRLKCRYVLDNQLAGVMIWALGQDLVGSSQPLLETIGKSLGLVTGVNLMKELSVSDFYLFDNYPNPFNPSTTIKFKIPEISSVDLSVYDLLGRKTATLVNEEKQPGTYEIIFSGINDNGIRLPSGIYMYRLETEKFSSTKKLVLLK